MAFCTNCGHQLADGAKFCAECGTPTGRNVQPDELSVDVNVSIRVVLKGRAEENTNVEVYLAHLNKTVALKVPNNVSLGQIFRLRGLGHVSPDGDKGDAYIRVVQIDYDNTAQEYTEPRRKVDYEGQVRKCPECGEVINAFVSICPSCGHEMRGSKATSAVHELAVKLDKTYSVGEKEKLIRNFYIPNTREDIIEFLILASSNIETNSDCVDAWAAKLEQVYQKAKLTFGDSEEFSYVETLYNKTTRELRIKKSIQTAKKATSGAFRGTSTVIGAIWNAICTVLRFFWKVICAIFGGLWKLLEGFIGLIKASELLQMLIYFIGIMVVFLLLMNSI